MDNLFIPERIRVGYRKRDDTYTGRLAYVVYYDKKGVLRKEKSWQGWRDKKIEPEEFENKPQDGFHLNKDIQRYNWSHFGSNRSMIRLYDSRGIEFEVTPENLIGILTETNCLKRGLEGEFVYAWHGAELVILPCCAKAYTEAKAYTKLQGKKISARDLKLGWSYTTKKGKEVIYMGRFPWFTWNKYKPQGRLSQKKHVFAHPTKPERELQFFPKNDATFLAELNGDAAVPNYAEMMDDFSGDIHSSVIERWESEPLNPTVTSVFAMKEPRYAGQPPQGYKHSVYTNKDGDLISFWRLCDIIRPYRYGVGREHIGYRLVKIGTLETHKTWYNELRNDSIYDYYHQIQDTHGDSKEQIVDQLKSFVKVHMVLSSGKKLYVREIGSVAVDR